MAESKISQVCKEIVEEVKPKEEEKARVFKIVSKVIEKLKGRIKERKISAYPELEGSVAHGTWLSGGRDIDIFILFPLQTPIEEVKRTGIELGREVSEGNWRERYAEHPFIEATIDGYRVDIVPCYKISKHSERVTAVDRTPLHTDYLSRRMSEKERVEIILLKAFMKGIGVYGAELRTMGFSGYLCELLILYYGSFEEVLRKALRWEDHQVIDIGKHYKDGEESMMIFNEPLVVIDPVDPKRNVAAAVSSDRTCDLKGAGRAFLTEPSARFFKPKAVEPINVDQLRNLMISRGTDNLFIQIPCRRISPDVAWGELRRSLRAITKLLELHDFKVLNSDVWSDEEKVAVMAIELASANLPSVRDHEGPKAGDPSQQKFIDKHIQNEKRMAGPWIKKGKWHIELRRDFTDAKHLIETRLREESAKTIGVSKDVGAWLKEGRKITLNEEVLPLYHANPSFAEFLVRYFTKQTSWLI